MNKNRNKKLIASFLVAVSTAIFVFVVRNQAQSAEIEEPIIERPYATTSNTETVIFPAIAGETTFKVISMPETQYTGAQEGSSIFTMWSGSSSTSHYLNFAHTGYVNELSDTFTIQFFDQTMCTLSGSEYQPPEYPYSHEEYTVNFTKPNLTPPSRPGTPPTRITIRSYDSFKLTWGNGLVRVEMQRFWRAIDLPEGVTAEEFRPNDFYIDRPYDLDSDSQQDQPSLSPPQVMTFEYEGTFSPFATRLGHGDPYDTEHFARPANVSVDGENNDDFNFYDIRLEMDGEDTEPEDVLCRLQQEFDVPVKVQPCGCLNNEKTKTCGDPEIPFVDFWPPLQFSLFDGVDWQVDDTGELRDAFPRYNEQSSPDAEVNLELNTQNPSPGDDFNGNAHILQFKSKPADTYFSWCVNGKTQQGLVAGGLLIEETKVGNGREITDSEDGVATAFAPVTTTDVDSSGCCDLATRSPQSDANNDGIDDDWQRRFGFKLTGDPNASLDANYDLDSSDTDGGSALPGDGYVADDYLALVGGRISVTPGSASSTGREFITGDGVFTAAEEYIWGTDPTEYDTDLDGYPDEADVVGVGQSAIELTSTIQPREFPNEEEEDAGNDRYEFKIKALGLLNQKRQITEEGTPATATEGFDLQDGVRITEDIKKVFARDAGEMSVTLTHTPVDPGLLDSVQVRANLIQGTRGGGNPVYYWYLKRVPGNQNNQGTGQPNGEDIYLQGEGLNIIEFSIREVCPQCQPGDILSVSVEVDDTVRGDVAAATRDIPIGSANSMQIFQDCNKDGLDEEVGSSTYCFKSAQVTKDIPVRVSIDFLDVASGNFYFAWKLDGVQQTENCLRPNQETTAAPTRCGFGTNQLLFTPRQIRKSYPIDVFVYKNDRNVPEGEFNPTPSAEIMHLTTNVDSGQPAVTIVFEPEPVDPRGGYALGAVTARAIVEFLSPTPDGQLTADPSNPAAVDGASALRYTWRDTRGTIIKTETLNSINGSTVAVDGSAPGTVQLSVEVESPDYTAPTNPDAIVKINDGATTYFFSGPTTPTALGILRDRLASLADIVPAPVRSALRVISIIVLGVGVVVLIVWLPKRKQRSSAL